MKKIVFLVYFLAMALFSDAQSKSVVISCYAPQRDMLRVYWHSAAVIKAKLEYRDDRIFFRPQYLYRDTTNSLAVGKEYELIIDPGVERDFVLQHLDMQETYRMQLERISDGWILDDQFSTSFNYGREQLRVQFAGFYHYFKEDRELKELLEYYTLDLLARPKFDPESEFGRKLIANNGLIKAFEASGRDYYMDGSDKVEAVEPQDEEQEVVHYENAEKAQPLSSESLEMDWDFSDGWAQDISSYQEFLANFPRQGEADSMGLEGIGLYRLRINPQGEVISIKSLKSLGLLDYAIFQYMKSLTWNVPSEVHDDVNVFITEIPFRYKQG